MMLTKWPGIEHCVLPHSVSLRLEERKREREEKDTKELIYEQNQTDKQKQIYDCQMGKALWK